MSVARWFSPSVRHQLHPKERLLFMIDGTHPNVQKILSSRAFAHLATIGSTGAPQSSPMWFLWDGEYLKRTHTTARQKYRNIVRDPRVALSILDLDEPYTSVEVRGTVERIEPDPTGAFYLTLAAKYGVVRRPPGDSRVLLFMKIQRIIG
jgi:PPOX class probable F420-dependent enzyme